MMVLMVQHEVAQRIVGNTYLRHGVNMQRKKEKKESLLSISVKAYGNPEMVMKVPSRYFSPAPEVDSAVIKISEISKKFFVENAIKEEDFWKIVHLGFAHKRKKLSGNLKNVVEKAKLTNLGLEDKRAEDLSLFEWLALVKSDTIKA